MAPKRLHLADPPCASSSSGEEESEEITIKEEEEQSKPTAQSEEEEKSEEEDEEEEGDDADDDDEEEEEEENNTPAVAKTRTPQRRQSSSESEDGNTKKTSSDFTLNPTASKPKGDSTKSKKPTSKSAVAVVSKPKAAKRPRPAAESGKKKEEKVESQRKKAKVSQEEKKSTGAVVRVWREEDEIVILKALIDYNQSKTGAANGAADMGEFPDFIKKLLSIDFTKAQLMDKVRKLKKKYKDNAQKVENGVDPIFSKSHQEKMFVLSKKIWGGEDRTNDGVDANAKRINEMAMRKTLVKIKNSVASPSENQQEIALKQGLNTGVGKEEFWSMYPLLKESLDIESSMQESQRSFLMDNMWLVESSKLREMEQKWNKWRENQVALYMNKVGLIQEQTRLLLEAMEST